ncbi:MAG: hypothetical protein LC687_07425 [Actinobacteria bacterium]|nr:hypothetical protein [Actinomycetota bacterium]
MIFLRRIYGKSMQPTLNPGQIIIGLKTKHAQLGDIVMIYHDGKEMLKRLERLVDNRIYVTGDNVQASTDSSSFGWLPSSAIRGVVIWPRHKKPQ